MAGDGEAQRGEGRGGSGRGGSGRGGSGRGGSGRGRPVDRQPAHRLKLEAGGRGMELICEAPGCEFVVWPVPDPTRKPAVEVAHRQHQGDLRFDSGWFGSCRCGWSSPKVGQDAARILLTNHERDVIQAAIRGS